MRFGPSRHAAVLLSSLVLAGAVIPAGVNAQTKAATTPAGAPPKPFVKPTDAELKKKLTPMQYDVTQHEGTEPPFHNEYWDNHAAGIYVDIVSGEPLFSSLDKFESGTGWPSFSQPLVAANFKTAADHSVGMDRTEVRSMLANSHLGHVFDDGPKAGEKPASGPPPAHPTGLRYCMNSASMRFIPVDKLVAEGYGQFLPLFKGK